MAEPRSLPSDAVERLLAAANGDAALLYLHFAAGRPLENAREALRMSEARYDLACATLQQLGLWPQEPQRHLDASQAPVYTEQDVIRETHTSREFEAITGETQRRLGRVLSNEELKILLSLIDYLRLPTEVVGVLLYYCLERSRRRDSRAPSMRAIEKEAYRWADEGIDTLETASFYVQQQLQLHTRVQQLRQLLQIDQRRLTPAEEKYLVSWIRMGFRDDTIRMAYERTCLNTGGLNWAYMNKILQRWQQQGFHSAEDVRTGDRKTSVPKGASGQLGEAELEAIQKVLQEG